MKIIIQTLFFTSLLIINNLHAACDTTRKRKSYKESRGIFSKSYRDDLQKLSAEDLEILEQFYDTVETGSLEQLQELFLKHRSKCEYFLGDYDKKPTRPPVLHMATGSGRKDIISTLIKYNADINLPDRSLMGNHNTPLHHAVKLPKPTRSAICQRFIAAGALVDTKNKMSQTPLYLACESFDDPHVPKLLIYHKANIHTQNHLGQTPLHIAVIKGHFEVVKLLLACGAKPWYLDYRNKTPMQIARENRDKDPENITYQKILTCLNEHNSFEAFVNDLFNFDEPESKRRRIDDSEF